ncbi:MAG: hypothetical protein ACFB2Z_02980 [Maricaulaceae bacterium]
MVELCDFLSDRLRLVAGVFAIVMASAAGSPAGSQANLASSAAAATARLAPAAETATTVSVRPAPVVLD